MINVLELQSRLVFGKYWLIELPIDENPRMWYVILEELTKLSNGSLNHVITDKLSMRKKSNRSVPHFFWDENKKKRLEFAIVIYTKTHVASSKLYHRDRPSALFARFSPMWFLVIWLNKNSARHKNFPEI